MEYTKVSISRKWYGKVPLDRTGKPIPRSLWPKRRKCSWEVRWYGSEGKRYSKSFKSRKEANQYAKQRQRKVDKGKRDRPQKTTLAQFINEHRRVLVGRIAHTTLKHQVRMLNLLAKHVGSSCALSRICPRDAESFIASRVRLGRAVATVNKKGPLQPGY